MEYVTLLRVAPDSLDVRCLQLSTARVSGNTLGIISSAHILF
jgi:hypothetical protein